MEPRIRTSARLGPASEVFRKITHPASRVAPTRCTIFGPSFIRRVENCRSPQLERAGDTTPLEDLGNPRTTSLRG
jgi:hypothetical protein